MRALILADEIFASRERSLLARLEIGLADEGVRIVHAMPDSLREEPPRGVYSQVVRYSLRTLSFARHLAAKRLIAAIHDLDRGEAVPPIEVIHVFGGSAWQLGLDVAHQLGIGAVLEIWRAGLVERARAIKPESNAPLLLAPDTTIERALHAGPETAPVRLAPWGVISPPSPHPILVPGRTVSVMLVGTGRDSHAFVTALEGLAVAVRKFPDMLVFCDALAVRQAGLWPLARKLGLLPYLTLIEELEGRRDLLLTGDVLIQPDAHGEQRSIVLEAFAAGMVVVALADPMVSTLQDGHTARLVSHPEMGEWAKVLTDVLSDSSRARAIGQQAHDFVRRERKASDHVRAVLAAYATVAGDRAWVPAGDRSRS